NDKAETPTEVVATPFAVFVWETLSRIDVSDHMDYIEATTKRPEIGYLSWSRAWMLLKRNFPGSTYSHRQDLIHDDGTVEVEVDVVIQNGGPETQFTNARLGVMDNWFNPIPHPTARQTNDARQRALVKALAFAGLGLNLWSDSVVPVGKLDDPISEKQREILEALVKSTETEEHTFLNWCEVDQLADLPVERFSSAKGLLEAKAKRQAKAKES
ncbi:unnamed protein product, partial [marine sediment metagenome]